MGIVMQRTLSQSSAFFLSAFNLYICIGTFVGIVELIFAVIYYSLHKGEMDFRTFTSVLNHAITSSFLWPVIVYQVYRAFTKPLQRL